MFETECSLSVHLTHSLLHRITRKTVVSVTRSVRTRDSLLTHHTERLQYVRSVTDGKPCCTDDVFLCCFPQYNQLNIY